jgi:hypothetical protein
MWLTRNSIRVESFSRQDRRIGGEECAPKTLQMKTFSREKAAAIVDRPNFCPNLKDESGLKAKLMRYSQNEFQRLNQQNKSHADKYRLSLEASNEKVRHEVHNRWN